MRKLKLVMVGNGMAGVRTLEELRKLAPEMYDITVFGAEPHPNYNRILLSPVLAGEMTVPDIILNDLQWYADNGIDLHLGARVTEIDRKRRSVTAIGKDGLPITVDYDRLLLATGSTPFMPPIPGNDLPGVISYRDIKDTDAMIDAAARYRHAVVIGAGLLGLEAANGLALRGMEVTVLHNAAWIMDRQLDRTAGRMLQAALEAKGMKFRMQAQTAGLVKGESGRVCAVRFKDGDTLPADLVCFAAGIRPNTELAEKAGIHCNRGIVVTDTLQTYDPAIYAVGECAAHRGTAYGLVAPLFEQAKVCANHLAMHGIGRYEGSVTSTKLKVTGIDVFSAGDFSGAEGTEDIVFHDPGMGIYKRLVLKDDKLVGAVLYGDTKDGAWYFQLLKDGQDVSALRDHLVFGNAHLGDVDDTDTRPAPTPLEAAHAKPRDGALCGCTDHTHGEVRQAIRDHKLLSVADAQRHLGWKTPDGCATCRPALDYYCLSTWPHEAIDDPRRHLGPGVVAPEPGHTVQTCSGQDPRCAGTARTTEVGTKLGTLLDRVESPHPLALGVSACRHDCPQSAGKDVGVIGMDSGYALYLGGDTAIARLVCQVADDDAVLEYSGAFIQLYREEAYFLEPAGQFLNRVGMDHVRRQVLDDARQRRDLHDRLLFARQRYKDPWPA